jgi:hypothetical protein
VNWKRPSNASIVVALVVALLSPVAWYVTFAETRQTPPMPKSEAEKMTPTEIESWAQRNERRAPFIEHLKSYPSFANEHREVLVVSAVVFVLILAMSSFSRGRRET